MKRIKVLKAYLIIWLFILYIVYTNAELLSVFFMATVIFSTSILGLLVVGTLYQIVSGYGIMMLGGTFGALAYKKTGYEFYIKSIDSLLPANIAHMLITRKSQQQMLFTQDESRNIIDWLDSKFRKQKSYINFFINTSMLIGLLGTFVGLVEAIDNMGQIILGLNGDIDIKQIMQDFSGPLSGMAIGFGASLFGVVSAVILGINGYILFRSQDTLISGVEDWLKNRIIDIAPEALGQATTGSTVALPEQRRSFIDLFLEQMTSFTQEVSKLTRSNENFHVMAQTLSSIKNVMEEQHQTLQIITHQQRGYEEKFDHLVTHIIQRDKTLDAHYDQDVVINTQQIELLTQHAASLQTISRTLEDTSHKIDIQQTTTQSLVTLNEQILHVNEQAHQRSFVAVAELKDSMSHESEKVIQTLTQNESKLGEMIERVVETNHQLSEIFTHVSNSAQTLSLIATTQNNQFDESVRAYAQMQHQLDTLDETLHEEIKYVELFTHQSREDSHQMILNQENAYHLFEGIHTSIEQTQQTLARVGEIQEAFKLESLNASSDLRGAIGEVEHAISRNKQSLESLLVAHEAFHASYVETQKESHETQKNSMVQEKELLDTVVSNLLTLEQTAQLSLAQNKAFEETYFTQSAESARTMIAQLSQKIESTQHHVVLMEQSLKNIEDIIARLDQQNTLHGPSVADEIKGFFGSLFTKNQ